MHGMQAPCTICPRYVGLSSQTECLLFASVDCTRAGSTDGKMVFVAQSSHPSLSFRHSVVSWRSSPSGKCGSLSRPSSGSCSATIWKSVAARSTERCPSFLRTKVVEESFISSSRGSGAFLFFMLCQLEPWLYFYALTEYQYVRRPV